MCLRQWFDKGAVLARWIKTGVVLVVVALACAGVVVATHWPFTKSKVILSLEQNYGSTVEFKTFRVTYFPVGCVAEGVTFRRNADRGAPPVATVTKLTIQGSYPGFLRHPARIPRVRIEGLHVFASPMVAERAILEVSSGESGAEALRFDIHKLTLNEVSVDRPMSFHAALRNPMPPGEIRADGRFGPLQRDNPGQTAASGSYAFDHADLGVFPGIGGTLSSTGKFGGVLEDMGVAGSTDVPDFNVTTSGHMVHLKTQFQAIVNGMNGDLAVQSVSAQFGHTTLQSHGEIASKPNSDGKMVEVIGAEQQGTIQDWLRLFAKAERPTMTGAMTFRVKVEVPPGERSFIQRVNLQGDFVIGSADFTASDTQKAVNNLSQIALGEKQDDEPVPVAENMKGHVEVQNTTATFTDLYFSVPGALTHLHGTYGILTEKIDLHGNLRVDNKLSKGSTGMKAVLLKIAEPFLKKKNAGEIVPIKIDGTFSKPSYGLDVTP
jgi:hypothetical protein